MRVPAVAVLFLLALSSPLSRSAAAGHLATLNLAPQAVVSQRTSSQTGPVLLTPSELESLLPATVYFRGRSASIQLRNAAGVRFGPDGYCLATIVDTSGYASSVQEKYQMYLITEVALTIAGQHLAPGAYGAGIVNGKLLVMDLGGHTLFQADASTDKDMARPRPLQMVKGPGGEVMLYLGRSRITLSVEGTP